jgi:hypothetical protein
VPVRAQSSTCRPSRPRSHKFGSDRPVRHYFFSPPDWGRDLALLVHAPGRMVERMREREQKRAAPPRTGPILVDGGSESRAPIVPSPVLRRSVTTRRFAIATRNGGRLAEGRVSVALRRPPSRPPPRFSPSRKPRHHRGPADVLVLWIEQERGRSPGPRPLRPARTRPWRPAASARIPAAARADADRARRSPPAPQLRRVEVSRGWAPQASGSS